MWLGGTIWQEYVYAARWDYVTMLQYVYVARWTMWQGYVIVAGWDYVAQVWLWQNGSEYGCVDY